MTLLLDLLYHCAEGLRKRLNTVAYHLRCFSDWWGRRHGVRARHHADWP